MRIYVVGSRFPDVDDDESPVQRNVAAFRDPVQAAAFVAELNDEWDRLQAFQRATEKKARRRIRAIERRDNTAMALLHVVDGVAFVAMVGQDDAPERVSTDTLLTKIARLDRVFGQVLDRPQYVIDEVEMRDATD